MKKFTYNELRNAWLNFYKERGHVDVGAVSLVSDGSTGVMFNVAGMQPLMPYLLGEKHPKGTRLCNIQGCVRTNDIDSVGDKSHLTFFEMMGSWSLGDYFKEDRCKWSFELLTDVFGFDADHLKLDCSKIKTKLKWAPKWDIDMAIKKTVEWTVLYLEGKGSEAMEQQIEEYFG